MPSTSPTNSSGRAYLAGLPPVRLHDLRHGAASLLPAAGVEMKVVQETLGHTYSAFTADTYTSVYPQTATATAEKTAALLFGETAPGELISLRFSQRRLRVRPLTMRGCPSREWRRD
ncbi:tyrosine-type recombinase/integrase [Nonomuraea sp. NPDC052116]|uniref:tyrosine-type recombinase/integrase n=1 Tax=Nonomuraea sp. NPDC052116 TaxID=3155665 RepID=UPI00341234C8